MSREETYDIKIHPLMAQIIAICKEHGIPVFATFQLDDELPSDDPRCCTTAIFTKDSADELRACYREVFGRRGPAFEVRVEDRDGNLTVSEVVVL